MPILWRGQSFNDAPRQLRIRTEQYWKDKGCGPWKIKDLITRYGIKSDIVLTKAGV